MGSAALFNWSVVLAFLLFNPQISQLLDLAPATGTNLALRDLALALVATFGFAYLYAAISPMHGRPFIALGALGKVLAALTIIHHGMTGTIGWHLPTLLLGDVFYSLLFIHFLLRYQSARNNESFDAHQMRVR
jgi:hypothetical protein